MTEDDVRRIFREELQRALPQTEHRGIPLPPNAPVVHPNYTYYPWIHPNYTPRSPNTCAASVAAPAHGAAS